MSRSLLNLHKLDRCCTSPQPSSHGDQRPNCLKQSERPRSLQESVGGTEDTGCGEGQDERSAAIFQRVADQHRSNRRQAEKSECIHWRYVSDRNIELERSMSSCYASRLSFGSSRSLYSGVCLRWPKPTNGSPEWPWVMRLAILESREPPYTRASTIERLAAT